MRTLSGAAARLAQPMQALQTDVHRSISAGPWSALPYTDALKSKEAALFKRYKVRKGAIPVLQPPGWLATAVAHV